MPAWGRGADFGTQMEGGEQSGSQGDVGTCREAQGGGALCLSSSAGVSAGGWAGGGQNDISEKKTKTAVVFNAGSFLLLEGANIKGRGTFWKKLSFRSTPALLKREAGVLGGGGARVPHARP